MIPLHFCVEIDCRYLGMSVELHSFHSSEVKKSQRRCMCRGKGKSTLPRYISTEECPTYQTGLKLLEERKEIKK